MGNVAKFAVPLLVFISTSLYSSSLLKGLESIDSY